LKGNLVWGWVKEAWHWLGQTTSVANWLLIILLIVTVLSVTLTVLRRLGRLLMTQEYAAYTEDRFFDLVWRWSWDARGNVAALWCYCPNCDRIVTFATDNSIYRETTTTFMCEYCNQPHRHAGMKQALLDRVIREIDLRVRNGTWRRVVDTKVALSAR
jgi:hypothetical protein